LSAKAKSLDEPALVRIAQNRMTAENERMLDGMRKRRRQERVEAALPRDIWSDIPEWDAASRMRRAAFGKAPRILNPVETPPDCIDMRAVYVEEEGPPAGKEPIEGLLTASEPVNTAEEAHKYAGHYIRRWKMERFHYALKSGCAIERLQERSVGKTTALVPMRSILAAMMLDMTYAARLTPDPPRPLFLGKTSGNRRIARRTRPSKSQRNRTR
jgi:hypothetical protein